MRIRFYSSIFVLFILLSTNVLADIWLDVANDLQQHIGKNIITPAVQSEIDTKLAAVAPCVDALESCASDTEKESIRAIVNNLESISAYYASKNLSKPVLGYIVSKADILRAMTQADIPPMGPVVTDILLQAYYRDASRQYERYIGREQEQQIRENESALTYVPEGVIVPDAPRSNTNQSIVIDISDQRLYAFEDGVLSYTTPITSGRR